MTLTSHEKKWFLVLLGVALLFRLGAAAISTGYQQPDEHYQILEPAHGLVYGYFDKKWEFERGLRSYVLPGFYAGCMVAIRKCFGTEDPNRVAWILRTLSAFFSMATLLAVFWIGRRLERAKDRNWISFSALTFTSLWFLFVYFGVRTQSEPLSMNFILLSAWLVLLELNAPNPKAWRNLLAGLFLGVAFSFRFQSGIVGISYLILYGMSRKWKSFGQLLLGCSIMILIQGLVDLKTWGNFLHSPIEYFRFNILENGASRDFGVDPWHRYLTSLNRFFTFPIAVMVIAGAYWSLQKKVRKRFVFLWVMILPYWLVHNLIGHKEDRFLVPIMPFVVLLTCGGWASWLERSRESFRRMALFWVLLFVLGGAVFTYSKHRWAWYGDQNQVIYEVSKQKDLRGLAVTYLLTSGSYFYLHRNVPLRAFRNDQRTQEDFYDKIPSLYNYLALFDDQAVVIEKLQKQNVRCELIARGVIYRCEESREFTKK